MDRAPQYWWRNGPHLKRNRYTFTNILMTPWALFNLWAPSLGLENDAHGGSSVLMVASTTHRRGQRPAGRPAAAGTSCRLEVWNTTDARPAGRLTGSTRLSAGSEPTAAPLALGRVGPPAPRQVLPLLLPRTIQMVGAGGLWWNMQVELGRFSFTAAQQNMWSVGRKWSHATLENHNWCERWRKAGGKNKWGKRDASKRSINTPEMVKPNPLKTLINGLLVIVRSIETLKAFLAFVFVVIAIQHTHIHNTSQA